MAGKYPHFPLITLIQPQKCLYLYKKSWNMWVSHGNQSKSLITCHMYLYLVTSMATEGYSREK
uniref:Uncharacterized protein n=1 Tax=Meloidogyne enterolobii TaxID=390850 RepID=A0A6V7WHQ6_MELEN|nr:unnamed protein product [Meloidogyne enterolobii]